MTRNGEEALCLFKFSSYSLESASQTSMLLPKSFCGFWQLLRPSKSLGHLSPIGLIMDMTSGVILQPMAQGDSSGERPAHGS